MSQLLLLKVDGFEASSDDLVLIQIVPELELAHFIASPDLSMCLMASTQIRGCGEDVRTQAFLVLGQPIADAGQILRATVAFLGAEVPDETVYGLSSIPEGHGVDHRAPIGHVQHPDLSWHGGDATMLNAPGVDLLTDGTKGPLLVDGLSTDTGTIFAASFSQSGFWQYLSMSQSSGSFSGVLNISGVTSSSV